MRSFAERLNILDTPMFYSLWTGIQRGIEKEGLRVSALGVLSKTPHPKTLGSSLTHPLITTDYSEALLELITEPQMEISALFQQLSELHRFAYRNLENECLWTASMPCRIPMDKQIPIAEYGTSYLGKLRRLYREGLGYRYGRAMQMIAGIHYNFSLPRAFWEVYQEQMESRTQSLIPTSIFITEHYLGMIRNIFRYGWLLALLFGASPAVSKTFFQSHKIPDFLEPLAFDKDTWVAPYATSLRLSDLGYHNKTGMGMFISYNSFSEFLKTMQDAIHTPHPDYTRIGVLEKGRYKQFSDGILQTEDEHYALVRPKCRIQAGERQLKALTERGIEYLEIRALDINPFVPLGIDEITVRVLDTFLMLCLIEESPPLMPAEMDTIHVHHDTVAKEGRKSSVHREKAKNLVSKMQDIAVIFDKAFQSDQWGAACSLMLERIEQPEMLLSTRVLKEMRDNKESYCDFVVRWSHVHQNTLSNMPFSQAQLDFYSKISENSHKQQVILEQETQSSHISFAEYIHQYLRIK